MTEEEYKEWKSEGDKRPGRCPFCNKPGWIVGDLEWCEHYVGTYDHCGSSGPINLLADDGAFEEFEGLLNQLRNLKPKRYKAILGALPVDLANFIDTATDATGRLFWLELVPAKSLEVDVNECSSETTYVSLFIEDPAKTREWIKTQVQECISAIKPKLNGNTGGLN